MVGGALVAEGAHMHVPKAYLYFAMAFSVGVEMINLRMRAKMEARKAKAASPGDASA
jgi:predicted tellurium resistance membrane protein TerC